MKRNQLIALAGAIVISIVVYLLPRTPEVQEVAPAESGNAALDQKVDEAVSIIQNGEGAPMQAISMLLDVLKEDPDHEKALLWLGNFSMMSGQWDKAVDRFHHLSELHPEVELYTVNKVQALLQVGDTAAALNQAQTYLSDFPEAVRVRELTEGL